MIARVARVAAIAFLAVCMGMLAGASGAGAPSATAGGSATLSLDMDVLDGGPCADIDAAATHDIHTPSFAIAVCLANPGTTPVAAFQYRLIYDDSRIVAPEVADAGTGRQAFWRPLHGSRAEEPPRASG